MKISCYYGNSFQKRSLTHAGLHEEGGDEGGDDRQDKIRNFIKCFAFH